MNELKRVYIIGVSHGWQCLLRPELTQEREEEISQEFAKFSNGEIEEQLRQQLKGLKSQELGIGNPAVDDPATGLREITAEEFEAFERFLMDIIENNQIETIVEEAVGSPHVRLADIATALGLMHKYCELTKSERAQLGIETHSEREQHWLEVIQTIEHFPLLMVCGADHVQTFSHILRKSGYAPAVVVADYEKTIF